jgi:hypothetical protein
VDRLIDRQSQELDRTRRLTLVWEIQRKLEADVARPMLSWRNEYFTLWPHVRNLAPHHSMYTYGRMQEVWAGPLSGLDGSGPGRSRAASKLFDAVVLEAAPVPGRRGGQDGLSTDPR